MNIVIVDDEELARDGLSLMLADIDDVNIVAYASDGIEAVDKIKTLKPDLVFLDINMPGKNGFEVIEAIGVRNMPRVVFITAYDEFAVDAFRVNALDYLMKPISEARLKESIARARNVSALVAPLENRLLELLKQMQIENSEGADRITIRADGHVYFLKPEEIIRVQAEGDYVSIYTINRTHLIRQTMKSMEDQLCGKGFQRIHRSSIVNLNEISELVSNDNGDYQVVLHDTTVLKLSRSYREALYQNMSAQ